VKPQKPYFRVVLVCEKIIALKFLVLILVFAKPIKVDLVTRDPEGIHGKNLLAIKI
jgi:hypothetical protein